MKVYSFDRRRRAKLILGVLPVGMVVSALVAMALVYLGRMHP